MKNKTFIVNRQLNRRSSEKTLSFPRKRESREYSKLRIPALRFATAGMTCLIAGLIFLILLIIVGCTTPKGGEKRSPAVLDGPQQPPPHVNTPAPVSSAEQALPSPMKGEGVGRGVEKLEELTVSPIEEETKGPERLYILSFRKADVHEILTILSRESELNIIVDPDVKGEVSVDLKEVPLDKALDSILTPLRLQYKREANFIRVSPIKMESRMFTLNYLSTKRGGSGMVSGTTGERGGEEGEGAGSFIKVETSDEVELWKEIEEGLKGISSEEGRFVINKVSGSILATDFPPELANMAQFLESIEGSAQRQVMIEAKIIEVTLSDEYQMGLNWAAVKVDDFPMLSQAISPANKIFQIGISGHNFSALLDAMSKQGKIDILSSPRVSTLNSQPAIIKVAREDVYWEREIVSETGGQALSSSSPRWITVGILLKVTPQIDSDGSIIMDIHPSIRERVGEAVSPEGDIAPILDVRETNTVVKVGDGNTIIIAGLLQKRDIKEVTSVPFLGEIPFLGAAFRKTVEQQKKTELIIMLTPTIVVGNGPQDQSTEGSLAAWREVR